MRRGLGRLTGLLLVLSLASACGTGPQAGNAGNTTAPKTSSQTASSPQTVASARAAPVQAAVAPSPKAKVAARTPPAPVDDDPQQFLDLTPREIAARLGPPRLIRRDGGVEVWQFAGDACYLDIFLYRNEQGRQAATYVDLRGEGLDRAGQRACLADMLRGQLQSAG